MTADLGPGTPLICVDGSNPYPKNPSYRLTEGAIYTVLRVYSVERHHLGYPNCSRCGKDGTNHYVVIRQRPDWGYAICRFKPIGGGEEHLKADNDRVFSPLFTLQDFEDAILRTRPPGPFRVPEDEGPRFVPITVDRGWRP